MNLQGKVRELNFDLYGKPILTLELHRMGDINQIKSLERDKELKIKLTEKNSNRTLEQNNLMWAIIAEIDRAVNGIPTEIGRWDIYTQGIEELGVEYKDVYIPTEALGMFRRAYRVCRIIEDLGDRLLLRCYTGSSRFTKKQMIELVDYFLRIASELGVTIIDYKAQSEEIFK